MRRRSAVRKSRRGRATHLRSGRRRRRGWSTFLQAGRPVLRDLVSRRRRRPWCGRVLRYRGRTAGLRRRRTVRDEKLIDRRASIEVAQRGRRARGEWLAADAEHARVVAEQFCQAVEALRNAERGRLRRYRPVASRQLDHQAVGTDTNPIAVAQSARVADADRLVLIVEEHAVDAEIGELVANLRLLDHAVPLRDGPPGVGQHPVAFRAPSDHQPTVFQTLFGRLSDGQSLVLRYAHYQCHDIQRPVRPPSAGPQLAFRARHYERSIGAGSGKPAPRRAVSVAVSVAARASCARDAKPEGSNQVP